MGSQVVILAPPRSGSSVITSIFAGHGLSLGRADSVNSYGYRTFENKEIRQSINHITHMVGPADKAFTSGHGPNHVKSIFERLIPRGDWCFKAGPQYWDVIRDAFPDAKGVLIYRNPESIIIQSHRDKTGKLESDVRWWVDQFVDKMARIHDEFRFPYIYTDEVMAGDYSSLRDAMDYCGLEFDPAIADKRIDKKQWHYEAG